MKYALLSYFLDPRFYEKVLNLMNENNPFLDEEIILRDSPVPSFYNYLEKQSIFKKH